ncbi:MAG: hypothetical protein NG740_06585 [Omnitrophica bacterium]|nr:hypothetical protein [Candidatus Omnitrophota bacterium]
MGQKTVRLGKVIVSLSIVTVMQFLPAWHTFADLPASGAYIPAPHFAHTQRMLKESVPANYNIEEAVLNVIDNTLLGLAREQHRIYSEYLSLKGQALKAQERQYAKKMNTASTSSITYLRKTLKNMATPFTMSKNRHNFKALFVLEKETIKPR